jgi:hypothetical protein
VHYKYPDSLAEAAAPEVVEQARAALSDRIEDLAQEMATYLE